MRISFIFGALMWCGVASATSDDEPLPATTKFYVDSISARVDDVRSHVDVVDISTMPTRQAVTLVAPAVAELINGNRAGITATETDQSIVIDLSADILFDFDRADLRPVATDSLQRLAALITSTGRHEVSIAGFTDSKGAALYNQRLSTARAESVHHWLVENAGLATIAFSIKGYGAEKPVASNTTPDGRDDPAGRQKNRRVEITIKK